ncbi:MAG: hypothetical protein H6807_12050 [Planctomycetes bacterium]|nr:hypothetical protein [Planctomycetota bacterium]
MIERSLVWLISAAFDAFAGIETGAFGTFGVEGVVVGLGALLLGMTTGRRQGALLILVFGLFHLVAEVDTYDVYGQTWATHHLVRTATLIEQLDQPDPTPASLLMALDPERGRKLLLAPEILEVDNPRLAEAIRALTDHDQPLGAAFHERLLEELKEVAADDRYARFALVEVVRMLGLRADEVTHSRLEAWLEDPLLGEGARLGLDLMAGPSRPIEEESR